MGINRTSQKSFFCDLHHTLNVRNVCQIDTPSVTKSLQSGGPWGPAVSNSETVYLATWAGGVGNSNDPNRFQ